MPRTRPLPPWIPAFAGMTRGGRDGGAGRAVGSGRVRQQFVIPAKAGIHDLSLEAVSDRQARRGRKSGKARRKATAEIVRAYIGRASMRAIGAEHGITARAVHRIVHRDAPLLASEPVTRTIHS